MRSVNIPKTLSSSKLHGELVYVTLLYNTKKEEYDFLTKELNNVKKQKAKAEDANRELKKEIATLSRKIEYLHSSYKDIIDELIEDKKMLSK
jgi:predicted  nucleic acid-binding Zn-ribbon protein